MAATAQPSPLDRFLRLFADVRAGEGITALLLSSNVFLLLTCYYILKSIRDGLILSEFSAEAKSYTSAAMAIVLIGTVWLYGKLADRVPRRRLINTVTMVFAACLVGFYVLAQLGVTLGIIFFVWVGIFNGMVIAQFWSFANDVYAKEEGERLFPIVAFGQSLGAVLGSAIAGLLIAPLGLYSLMLFGAALLVAQLLITNYVDARERVAREAHLAPEEMTDTLTATGALRIEDIQRMLAERDRKADGAAPDSGPAVGDDGTDGVDVETGKAAGTGAFALVFRTRYLLMIAVMMMLLNFVNTNGEYILGGVVARGAAEAVAAGEAGGLTEAEYISTFYANFFAVVNLAGLLIQLFLVSRIVKYIGVAGGLMILPVISLGAYSMIALYPVLQYIRWAKTAENATDYSLNNTVRNMLFLPTTREQKYKAKQAIDSFFVRLGDTMQALLVLVGTTVFALNIGGFVAVNIVVVLAWLVLAYMIGKEYKRLVATGETPS